MSKQRIRWADGSKIKLEGDNPGTETVLMLARPTKLEATDAEVKSWFAGLEPVPFGDDNAVAWFENFDSVLNDPQRALRTWGKLDPNEVGGPHGLQMTLRQRIGTNAGPFSTALSYSRLGTKKEEK